MDTLTLTLFQLLIFQLGLLLTLNPPKSKDSPLTVPVESDHRCLYFRLLQVPPLGHRSGLGCSLKDSIKIYRLWIQMRKVSNTKAKCPLPAGGDITLKYLMSQCQEHDFPRPRCCLGYRSEEKKTHNSRCQTRNGEFSCNCTHHACNRFCFCSHQEN